MRRGRAVGCFSTVAPRSGEPAALVEPVFEKTQPGKETPDARKNPPAPGGGPAHVLAFSDGHGDALGDHRPCQILRPGGGRLRPLGPTAGQLRCLPPAPGRRLADRAKLPPLSGQRPHRPGEESDSQSLGHERGAAHGTAFARRLLALERVDAHLPEPSPGGPGGVRWARGAHGAMGISRRHTLREGQRYGPARPLHPEHRLTKPGRAGESPEQEAAPGRRDGGGGRL